MAETTVSLVVEKLRNLLVVEGTFLAEVGDEIEWIELELRRILCFLRDADREQETDEKVKHWVEEIRETSFRVEDVADAFVQKFGSLNRRTGLKNSLKRYASIPQELQARRAFGKEIQSIKTSIREITASRPECVVEVQQCDSKDGSRRLVARNHEEADVVGFGRESEKLAKLLLGVDRRRVTVSIVGMAGTGKTTLARKVYDNVGGEGFECCVWIGISQGRDVNRVVEEMAGKAMGLGAEEIDITLNEDLEERLRGFLKERRYLVVLDDLRTEIWEKLNPLLPNSNNGSRLLITTTSVDVATSALPCFPPHDLQPLSEEETWDLFTRKAFTCRREIKEACTAELTVVGRQIVNRCCGLPLAVELLAGMISRKACNPVSWAGVAARIGWGRRGNPCLEVLDSCFGDLPCHLKPCFLYLSAFPDERDIDAEKLIALWVAEGFVRKTLGQTFEETGERYLEELVQRQMVQISSTNTQGQVESCRVHDLILGYSISKSREINFLHSHTGEESVQASTRRLAIRRHSIPIHTGSARDLRTFLNFGNPSGIRLDFKRQKLLRVLDLEGALVQALPKEIGEFVHLRYLGLKGTGLKRLPSSACDLYNLQILDVRNTDVFFLPDGVWAIKTLRHVYGSRLQAPESIGGSCLQTLDAVAAGPWIESSLSSLAYLRKLSVFRFEADKSYAGLLPRTLTKLQHLDSLLLSAGEGPLPIELLSILSGQMGIRVMSLRGSLARCLDFDGLPPNLTRLSLRSTRLGPSFWFAAASLKNLRSLVLEKGSYVGSEMPCAAGSFPQLHELSLENLESLTAWKLEKKAMPCLARLRISNCPALAELPSGLRHLKNLRRLEIEAMPPSFCNDFRDKKRKNVSSVTIDGTLLK